MAFNPDHAKRMRNVLRGTGRIVQVGIQSTSTSAAERIREYLQPETIGEITAIHTHHYRNARYGGWKRAVPADCDAQHFDWTAFEGEARKLPFDGNRAINWRFFWDYSGGNVFENMVHQVGFWYKMLSLEVPASVTMTGANYRSPEMEVPDTMDVSMVQSEKLLFTWNSMFGNDYYGEGDDLVLGNKGTIHRDPQERVRFEPQGRRRRSEAAAEAAGAGGKAPDIVGGSEFTDQHMQNFVDCVRSRKEPNCPLEIGYRSAIACRMAVESYRQGRTVRWDKQREEIV